MNSFYGDYHTHSRYSDAKNSLRDNVKAAVDAGLLELGVTDHGFGNYVLSLTKSRFKKRELEIEKLRREFPQIKLLSGIEADILDEDGNIDLTPSDIEKLDVVILGFHRFIKSKRFFKTFAFCAYNGFLSKWFKLKPSEQRIERNTNSYASIIEKYPIDILAHINHYTKVDYVRLASVCAKRGTLVEINLKHLDLMETMIDELVEKTDCVFLVTSDAHKAADIGKFSRGEEFIKKHNIPKNRVANLDKRPQFRREIEGYGQSKA